MAGCLERVRFFTPDPWILAAPAPKPVGGYTETILRVIDVVFQALAKAAPGRVNGCAYGTINALSLAGHRKDGRRWGMFLFFGGGLGGRPGSDGPNPGNRPLPTPAHPPTQIPRAAHPGRFTHL